MIDTMAAIASLPFDVKIELSDRPWRPGKGDLLRLTVELDAFNVEHTRALPTCIEIARNYLGRKRIIYSRTLVSSVGGVSNTGLTTLVIKSATGCFGGAVRHGKTGEMPLEIY